MSLVDPGHSLISTIEWEDHPEGSFPGPGALMAPGSDVTALRDLFAEMLTRRENVQLIADLLAGADVRYDMGDPDPDPATGWFAPILSLTTQGGRPREGSSFGVSSKY